MEVSSGNALQCMSRELYRIGKYFDLPRLMSFYFTGAGFFVINKLTTIIIYMILLTWLLTALTRSESVPHGPLQLVGLLKLHVS
ncbi:MAG: hypothetical protein SGPRY_000839 [Prymnesium sp.]